SLSRSLPMTKCLCVSLAVAVAVALAPAAPSAVEQVDLLKPTVEKAAAYLKKSQNEDGSWSPDPARRGVTGVVVTGLMRTGAAPGDAPVAKGLSYIETLVNKKDGHIAGNDAKAGLINYTTSINVMALTAANAEKYRAVTGNAVKYLKEYQWDEARGKKD